MKLPNGSHAIVSSEKLRDYCLNPDHPRGKHKARIFASILGITASDVQELREALLLAAVRNEASPGLRDEFGQRYVIDFYFRFRKGRAEIRSTWIVIEGEEFPRLSSCYVK